MEGQQFHVYLNEPGNEPSTIGDFRGLVAINHLQGEGTVIRGGPNGGLATPTATGDRIGYDADMRIMKGQYIGEDGQEHEGTFGFIWFDLFAGAVAPDFSNQIHDFTPGIAASGLFWTIPFSDDDAWVDLAAGKAEMHALSLPLTDSYTFGNSISDGPTTPATASFDVWWHSPTSTEQLHNEEQGFAATLLDLVSGVSFSAETAGFAFVSDSADKSQSLFARIGYEANGVFLPPAGVQATPTS
jgi:hypothetical protein